MNTNGMRLTSPITISYLVVTNKFSFIVKAWKNKLK